MAGVAGSRAVLAYRKAARQNTARRVASYMPPIAATTLPR